ncbi:MAG: S41 family peptidase, partial [Cryobacterium sp.]
MRRLCLLLTLLAVGVPTGASPGALSLQRQPDDPTTRPTPPVFRPDVRKRPGHYSKADWRRAIDSVWGEGLPTETKLAVMDSFKFKMDRLYACFNNLDPARWDSLYAAFRAEVEDTVSRGRFAAMMGQSAMALREPHTYLDDRLVCEQTELLPGVPVFVIAGWRWDTHFGAGLTPLEDSSLLVYEVDDNHPLGIVPGDVILGYDRRPWTECCRELLEAQLPIGRRFRWAAEDRSLAHTLLVSAGQNWHLFDTVDIVRYASGDTVHLPTSLMVGYEPDLVCCEELDVPGVPKPDLDSMIAVSWGIIEGDSIGYIYVWAWVWDAASKFRQACSTLTAASSLKGIIIDYRYNEGGQDDNTAMGGYRFLFSSESTFSFCGCTRSDPVNRFAMRVVRPPSHYAIAGKDTGYSKPLAVLTGPGAWSMGDWETYRTALRPGNTRTFGKPTNGAFIGNLSSLYIHNDFQGQYAYQDLRRYDDSAGYLTHIAFEPDTAVWHTREAVAQGRDAVVEAAIAWINA